MNKKARKIRKINHCTLYVSKDGSDYWSGLSPIVKPDKADGPLATVNAAINNIRQYDKNDRRKIVLRSGRYFLSQPIILGDQDQGLSIVGAPNQDVVLCGGRKIDSWKRDGESFCSVELPGVKEGKWRFRTLVVNGRLSKQARLPENGSFNHLSEFNVEWLSTSEGGVEAKAN